MKALAEVRAAGQFTEEHRRFLYERGYCGGCGYKFEEGDGFVTLGNPRIDGPDEPVENLCDGCADPIRAALDAAKATARATGGGIPIAVVPEKVVHVGRPLRVLPFVLPFLRGEH